MKPAYKALLLSSAMSALLAPVAMAQDENPFLRGRYESVTEREQPEFDPEPVRAGSFNIWSSLGLGAEYNDNIFAAPSAEESDTVIRVTPRITARSDWSAHELAAGANVDHQEFLENGSESATDYNVFLNGRLDATRNLSFRAGVDAGEQTEDRFEVASFNAAERARFSTVNFFGSALYRQDRIQIEATAGVYEQKYDQLVQQIRDNESTYLRGRVSYAVSPDIAFFVQARQEDQDYNSSDRDGTRKTIDAGVNFELAAPFRGEIAVGAFEDDRDSLAYADTDGLSVAANIEWFPTQLTTVTFTANRGAYDPGIAASASAVNEVYGVRVDHELYRNIILFGSLRNERTQYEGLAIDREDDLLAAAVGMGWKLNKNAHLEAAYTVRSQDSSGLNAGPDLDQNIISAAIRFYP
jgi:hypothetical protein